MIRKTIFIRERMINILLSQLPKNGTDICDKRREGLTKL